MSLLNLLFGSRIKNNKGILLLPEEFKANIKNRKVQLVDVRTLREYDTGHIKGAINIDFYSRKFNIEFNKLKKNRPVYLYCRTGIRSRKAANKMATMDFLEIYDLQGGYINWK
ncbi:MAG: rhodanese-like domain-containing protein [Flavobacteriaceae bacterium]|nr:rhodanese-like domain-containing protein [Flavobacteriaceae bacterium]